MTSDGGAQVRGTRVALVEGQELTRQGMAQQLEGCEGLELVLCVGQPEELIAALEKGTEVDAVVLDLQPQGVDAIGQLKTLRERWPALRVLATASRPDERCTLRAYHAGAHGLFDKDGSAGTFVRAWDTVRHGGCYHTDRSQELLLRNPDGLTPAERSRARLLAQLNPEHRKLLCCLLRLTDPSTQNLSEALGKPPRTVDFHLSQLYDAFGTRSKTGVVLAAFRLGLNEELELVPAANGSAL